MTLEDILQRDPREKLEIFSKLGYYFISFRAIENEATREKIRREASITGNNPFDDISVGEANVYLTVFKDGICCVSTLFSPLIFLLTFSQVPLYRCV